MIYLQIEKKGDVFTLYQSRLCILFVRLKILNNFMTWQSDIYLLDNNVKLF